MSDIGSAYLGTEKFPAPTLKPMSSRSDLWLVVGEWMVKTPVGSFIVPDGFVSDLASFPRIIPIGLRHGWTAAPAVLHDWLCEEKPIDSEICHRLWYWGLRENGCPEREARNLWWWVNTFGPKFSAK